MIFKWKKKASKQELFDIIKIQEEEISRLYKEKMNFYIVIRNKKPIRIEKQGLDYMVELEQQLKQKENIIKEVREYIASFNLLKNLGALEKEPISISELKHILELLNIGEDDEEN